MKNRTPELKREIAVLPSYAAPSEKYDPRTGRIGEEILRTHPLPKLSPTEEVERKYFLEVKGGEC